MAIGGGRDGTELGAEASCSWVTTGRMLAAAAGSRVATSRRRERVATSNERREGRRRRRDGPSLRDSIDGALVRESPMAMAMGDAFSLEGEGGGRRNED
ncbi:unnamed protein product [Linum trigynum]|uniref:Uncharacterized protein n=1 Tax=Linum trigynum TaxID=586398 RepID=A0AAV2E7L8_9ROSI